LGGAGQWTGSLIISPLVSIYFLHKTYTPSPGNIFQSTYKKPGSKKQDNKEII